MPCTFAICWIAASSLLLVQEPAPSDPVDERFTLENGLIVSLHPDASAPAAVVMLGVFAGVYDEPEERSGLAHLAEHMFLHGGTSSAEAGSSFELLTKDGPLHQPWIDVNAETLWNLTYFYALRPPRQVDLPIELFAEKMAGVQFDAALLDIERTKAIQEVEQATAAMESSPVLREQMRAAARRAKAGTKEGLLALDGAEIQAFLHAHYAAERSVLLVAGAFDAAEAKQRIVHRFGALSRREVASPVTEERAAEHALQMCNFPDALCRAGSWTHLRVFAAAWQRALRKHGRAFVELSGTGAMRAVHFGAQPELLSTTRASLQEILTAKEWKQVVKDAGREAKQYQNWMQQSLPKGTDRTRAIQGLAQLAIYRVRFEAEGGAEFLNQLAALTPEELAAVAQKF